MLANRQVESSRSEVCADQHAHLTRAELLQAINTLWKGHTCMHTGNVHACRLAGHLKSKASLWCIRKDDGPHLRTLLLQDLESLLNAELQVHLACARLSTVLARLLWDVDPSLPFDAGMAAMKPRARNPDSVGVPSLHHPFDAAHTAVVKRVVLHLGTIPDDAAAPGVARKCGAGSHEARSVLDEEANSRPTEAPPAHGPLLLPIREPHFEGAVLVVPSQARHPVHAGRQNLNWDAIWSIHLRLGLDETGPIRERRCDGGENGLGVVPLVSTVEQEICFIEDHELHILDSLQSLPACHLILAGTGFQALRSCPWSANKNVGHLLGPSTSRVVDGNGATV
mmetsp:Transcript_48068/g.112529  ORF Transcript_48068/g.112529 Transcript_48068/m.112529 type:complete len:339 (+) Transcript_48068:372-1388(+)